MQIIAPKQAEPSRRWRSAPITDIQTARQIQAVFFQRGIVAHIASRRPAGTWTHVLTAHCGPRVFANIVTTH